MLLSGKLMALIRLAVRHERQQYERQSQAHASNVRWPLENNRSILITYMLYLSRL